MICVLDVDIDVVVVIFFYEVLIRDVRDVFLKEFLYVDVVKVSVVSNIFIVVIMFKDWLFVGKIMKKDMFYQLYWVMFVFELLKVEYVVEMKGVYGMVFSGVGLMIFVMIEKGKGEEFKEQFVFYFFYCEVDVLIVLKVGSIVE